MMYPVGFLNQQHALTSLLHRMTNETIKEADGDNGTENG